MSKRILFFLINMNLGGTEKSFLNLIDSLPTDVEVDLLLLESKGQLLEHLPGRINLRIIEENKSVNFLIQNSLLLYAIYCLKKLDIFQMLRAIFFYGKSKFTKRSDFKFETISNRLPMRSEKYDIAVAYAGPHNFISSYVAKKTVAKKKIQWIHFDVSKINYNKKSSETLYQYFDEIKVVSKKAKTQFLKFFPKLNSKTEVFYNVLNKDAIQLLSKDSNVGFQDNFEGLRILTVGRLTEEKGHVLAISALRALLDEGHHVRYYIIGDGDHKERLKKEVNKLNLQENVIFLAATLNPYPFMRQTDIYLQPSFYEGHCITILEAKLLNKAMVCTNFTGAEEELREGITGLIVDIDSIAIFEGLKKLIENDNLRQSFEKNLIMEGLKTAVDPVASLFFSTLK